MTSYPILSLIDRLQQIGQPVLRALGRSPTAIPQRSLTYWAQHPAQLPDFVRHSTVAMHYVHLLSVLDWTRFPERNLQTRWTHAPVPYAPFVAACLVKLDRQLPHMSQRESGRPPLAVLWYAVHRQVPRIQQQHVYGALRGNDQLSHVHETRCEWSELPHQHESGLDRTGLLSRNEFRKHHLHESKRHGTMQRLEG